MMDENKPPLGVKPYQIAISNRIIDLSGALYRRSTEGYVNNTESIELMKLWATEIAMLCDINEKLSNLR